MKAANLSYLVLVFLFAVGGCSKPVDNNETSDPVYRPTSQLTATEKTLVQASNTFAFKLFKEIAKNESPDSNIFISPLSVAHALSMTYNGAAGTTREAMAQTLEVAGIPIEEVNNSFSALTGILMHADHSVNFRIANSIWYRPGEAVLAAFENNCRTYYDAVVKELNFNLPTAADSINNWVSDNTGGLIDELLKPPIDCSTVMYLINAIYFKGAWSVPFDPGNNRDTIFYGVNDKEHQCTLMCLDTNLYYMSGSDFDAVDLTYNNGLFRMTLLLPHNDKTVDAIIDQLTVENWELWKAGFLGQAIKFGLPKFEFGYGLAMNDVLKALGMEIAFDPSSANFTNMIEGGGIWIDTVLHKSYIKVNEEGTEAAAVTSVEMCRADPQMFLNHPFLFVIRENESDAILFMGKIVNPVCDN